MGGGGGEGKTPSSDGQVQSSGQPLCLQRQGLLRACVYMMQPTVGAS